MPRAPLINDRERTIIAIAFNENRGEKAETIRQIASEMCRRELGLSTVQRELALLRKQKTRSTDPFDNQWTLASVRKYPVDPATLPLLLYIQDTFDDNRPEELRELAKAEGRPPSFMTIRLATWISRLYPLLASDKRIIDNPTPYTANKDEPANQRKWSEWLDDFIQVAMWYSNYEIGCELAHIEPINTIHFDAPTLGHIRYNIDEYHGRVLRREGINPIIDPVAEQIQKMRKHDVDSIVPKGGKRNARTHYKKRQGKLLHSPQSW